MIEWVELGASEQEGVTVASHFSLARLPRTLILGCLLGTSTGDCASNLSFAVAGSAKLRISSEAM